MSRVQMLKCRAALVGVAVLSFSGALRADAVEDFYRDKQLNLLIGYETGGGYDTFARTLARHMGQYIPGKPAIIARNMPGAGSLTVTNYIYNVAPKDGATLAAVGREMPTAALFGQENIRFRTDEFT